MTAEWLTAKGRSYWADSRRLAAMGDEIIGDLTGDQWAIVYRAVAEELRKCADEPRERVE